MIVNDQPLKFDLKKPCKDCPFRKDAEYHEGVFADLVKHFELMSEGRFVHSCHKTDPRADSEEGKRYQGPTQHCAGLLHMMNNDASLLGAAQVKALITKEWKPGEMCKESGKQVFKSFREMGLHYAKLYRERNPQ